MYNKSDEQKIFNLILRRLQGKGLLPATLIVFAVGLPITKFLSRKLWVAFTLSIVDPKGAGGFRARRDFRGRLA